MSRSIVPAAPDDLVLLVRRMVRRAGAPPQEGLFDLLMEGAKVLAREAGRADPQHVTVAGAYGSPEAPYLRTAIWRVPVARFIALGHSALEELVGHPGVRDDWLPGMAWDWATLAFFAFEDNDHELRDETLEDIAYAVVRSGPVGRIMTLTKAGIPPGVLFAADDFTQPPVPPGSRERADAELLMLPLHLPDPATRLDAMIAEDAA